MKNKSIEKQTLETLSKKLTDLWEDSLNERRDANGAWAVPDQNRSLPGFSTPAQATTQFTNLKQNQRYMHPLVKSPAGHLQISVNGSFFKKADGGAVVKGNTVDLRHRRTYGKPFSLDIDPAGYIINKDLRRLNDEELEAVEYNLAVRNKHFLNLQPGQIAGQVHENVKSNHHKKDKEHDGQVNPQTADPLNYHGTDLTIKTLLQKASQEVGPKQNHLETLLAFLARKEEEHQANIEKLLADNESQRKEIERLVKDISSKEQRFQDFNKQVAQQADLTVQKQAQMAQDQAQQIAQQPATQSPAPQASNVVPMRPRTNQAVNQNRMPAANARNYRQAAESIDEGYIDPKYVEIAKRKNPKLAHDAERIRNIAWTIQDKANNPHLYKSAPKAKSLPALTTPPEEPYDMSHMSRTEKDNALEEQLLRDLSKSLTDLWEDSQLAK